MNFIQGKYHGEIHLILRSGADILFSFEYLLLATTTFRKLVKALPDMPILDSSSLAANKDIWQNYGQMGYN